MAAPLALLSDEARLDGVFHALSDPTRRAILARLAGRSATVTDLAEPFEISLPAVSRHLKVLERAGLISRAIDGRLHRCSLEAGALRDVEEWVGPYREFWEAQFSAIGRLLAESHGRNRRGRPGRVSVPSRDVTRPRRSQRTPK
jgi:DNA-binding transcriptional ArsR family regulator